MNPDQIDVPSGTFMPKKRFKIRIPWSLISMLAAMVAACIFIVIAIVQMLYASRIQSDIGRMRPKEVAIVLGASVTSNGEPSDALMDRIVKAAELYHKGLVKKLLMTGDDGRAHADEVSVMVDMAQRAGVPAKDIIMDGHGYRTYESCKRAIDVYHITDATVVTQRFHLARALFLCNQLGIDAIGYVADRQSYKEGTFFWMRDALSSAKAFWDVYVDTPLPPVEYPILISKDSIIEHIKKLQPE
jgi:SanA protein